VDFCFFKSGFLFFFSAGTPFYAYFCFPAPGKTTFSLLAQNLKDSGAGFLNKCIMILKRTYPYLLTMLQLGSLAYLGLSAPVIAKSWDGILLESAGILLALHTIYIAGFHNVNITPTPKTGARLVTGGPFRLVRHPMYLAQLVALAPLVLDYFTYGRVGVFVLLTITLIFKMHYEEKGLKQQFGRAYDEYMQRTKKILPFIY
jgi:protein-S-isoprenylcysteine O-methyltransferase Ste14